MDSNLSEGIMKLFAYIDPGTGSLFIQAVIGIVLAGGVFFRSFFKKVYRTIRNLFRRPKTSPKATQLEEENEAE